jgi:prepilin-type N-terminal cleavage/methylation domain-containing protein
MMMRRDSGFSLLEVMCAILILGIGVVGLTHGISTALGSSKESELQTAAALIAASRIELLRADGFIVNGEDQGECGEGLTLYRWKQSVTSTSIDGLHDVNVTIEHTKSGQAIYELRTMLFDPPISSSSTQDSSSNSSNRSPSQRRQRRGK